MMKLFFALLLTVTAVFAGEKKTKLSPYQKHIDNCFKSQFSVAKMDTNKKLYRALNDNFALLGSETTFREVLYREGGEVRKLKYEDHLVRIFKVNEDESIKLLSEEELGYKPSTIGARYKTATPEARLNELLIHAEIKTDYIKTREYRSKQVLLNIVWSDNQIKALSAELPENKRLECQRKDSLDICDCH